MTLKMATLGSLLLTGALATITATESQAVVLTGSNICQATNGAQAASVSRFTNAVGNASAAAIGVVCPVPRYPGVPPQFLISGNNSANTTTCTLTLFNAAGGVVSALTFNSILGGWTATLNFAAPPATGTEFATLSCALPPSNTGLLIGFQSNP